MEPKDMWGEVKEDQTIRTPVIVMREQAILLEKKTNGILIGKVKTKLIPFSKNGQVRFASFDIVAPLLGNYSFRLLELNYDIIKIFPINIFPFQAHEAKEECQSIEEFEHALELILSDQETSTVISSLLAQSRLESKQEACIF